MNKDTARAHISRYVNAAVSRLDPYDKTKNQRFIPLNLVGISGQNPPHPHMLKAALP